MYIYMKLLYFYKKSFTFSFKFIVVGNLHLAVSYENACRRLKKVTEVGLFFILK